MDCVPLRLPGSPRPASTAAMQIRELRPDELAFLREMGYVELEPGDENGRMILELS